MHFEEIVDQARAFWTSRVILTAVELDLFTALGDNERSLKSLTGDLRLSERGLGLLMDALAGLGLLRKAGDEYANSEVAARYLDRNSPEYRGGTLRHQVNLWRSWDRLTEVVRTGRPAERDGASEGDWTSFIQAMHQGKADETGAIVASLKLRGVRRAIDLGGGAGTLSRAMADAEPRMEITLFDLPEALRVAETIVPQGLWGRRIKPVAGDFFIDSIGSGYDLAVMSSIIHSYGPEANEELLRKVFEALEPGGRVAVRDFWLDDSGTEPKAAALFSINMLVNTESGRSYSETEFVEILKRAGFSDPERLARGTVTDFIVAFKRD